MRIVMSTVSKFYSLDIARQLLRLGALERLYTGRPRWKLHGENLPPDRIDTFPFFQTIHEALPRLGLRAYAFETQLNWLCHTSLDRHIARNLVPADVYHALAYCGLESGREAQRRGMRWICDAPTPHLSFEHEIVAEEASRVGVRYRMPDNRFRAYAEESYAAADAITVASDFSRRTFELRGVPPNKIHVLPYGADLSRFRPIAVPPSPGFNVLFVGALSLRKGIHDLIKACRMAAIPDLTLSLVGSSTPDTPALLRDRGSPDVRMLGHRPKDQLPALYSAADVLVLPSICDGFGSVIVEALACGCPVIAATHAGGAELIRVGVNGFVVPIRSPGAIAGRLVDLRQRTDLRAAMREAATRTIASNRGWDAYGDALIALCERLSSGERVSLPRAVDAGAGL